MAITKRNVLYNILSVDRNYEHAVVIEYEFDGVLFEAAMILKDKQFSSGCKKYTSMQTGEIHIESLGYEGDLLIALAKDFEHAQETA